MVRYQWRLRFLLNVPQLSLAALDDKNTDQKWKLESSADAGYVLVRIEFTGS
jgi:hypothetical protein